MMLIYPAIDILAGKCVRLRQGDYARSTVFSDDPVAVARQWVEQGARQLHIVDLDGAKAGKPINVDVIAAICDAVAVPVQLGGGIRTDNHLIEALTCGVQWVVLGTKGLQDPGWVRSCAFRFPNQIVLGVDARDGLVATDGWLNTSTTKATDLVKLVEDAPLFAVVYTDIAKDGMMGGPNFELLGEMRSSTTLRVIASGGVSSLDHIRQLSVADTYAAIVGRALYDGGLTLSAALEAARI